MRILVILGLLAACQPHFSLGIAGDEVYGEWSAPPKVEEPPSQPSSRPVALSRTRRQGTWSQVPNRQPAASLRTAKLTRTSREPVPAGAPIQWSQAQQPSATRYATQPLAPSGATYATYRLPSGQTQPLPPALPSPSSQQPSKGGVGGKPGMPLPRLPSAPLDGGPHNYSYPPRMPLPIPTCFYNPTGYPCCNTMLNDLIVETYTELEARPRFHACNINAIANQLQKTTERRFNTTFETIVSFSDFAQKIHFKGDLVCKVELGGRYMLTYATVKEVSRTESRQEVPPQSPDNLHSGGNEKRKKREAPTDLNMYWPRIVRAGPENQLPLTHISKTHTMWI